jgi:UDP-2,3-diacylglucosamine hydrolase
MQSRGKSGPVAIIAGAGRLPAEIAADLASRGSALVVLTLRGFADADYGAFRTVRIDLLDPQGAIAALREVGAGMVVLAGTVHKPGLGHVMAGWHAVLNRHEIRRIVQGGDDNLLRGVVSFLEESGFPVVGVRDVAPALMAEEAAVTSLRPDEAAAADIARGFEAIAALGPLDVGQAAVVAEKRIIALEAAEGTDAMLRRVALLRRGGPLARLLRHGRPPIGELRGGVLVKAPKPGQDFRVDLPVVGPRTIRLAASAGLAGVAVEAGGVLYVERAAMAAEADRLGLFVTGAAR